MISKEKLWAGLKNPDVQAHVCKTCIYSIPDPSHLGIDVHLGTEPFCKECVSISKYNKNDRWIWNGSDINSNDYE